MRTIGSPLKLGVLLIGILMITCGFVLPLSGVKDAFESGARGSLTETEDPLDTLVEGFGVNNNDRFGWNISGAGDVNNDGYDDIIVGAPYYDLPGQNNAGAAFLFFGDGDWTDDNISAEWADVRIEGNDADDHFGWDVSGIGDINGDGISDFIIGAPDEDWWAGFNIWDGGMAYIYYGSSNFGSTGVLTYNDADDFFSGTNSNQRFGFSVAGAGDINGDSYDDVIVGAPGGSYSVIRFGWDSVTRTYITPDTSDPLWDDTKGTANYVDFNALLNTSNSFSPPGPNPVLTLSEEDGWDWAYDWDFEINGYQYENSSHLYGPQDDTGEGLPWDNSSRLLAVCGPTFAGNDGYDYTADRQDYCAWGVQINITNSIFTAIQNKAVIIEFDWEAFDTGQELYDRGVISTPEGTNYRCWVKSQFYKNGTDPEQNFLGVDFEGPANEPEIFYVNQWVSPNNDDWGWNNATGVVRSGTYSEEISSRITAADQYYFTYGVAIGGYWQGGGSATVTSNQGVGAYLDNVTMYYTDARPVDITITGSNNFGWDVAGGGDINNDGIDDVIISNPRVGSPGSKGEVSVFLGYPSITNLASSDANSTISGLIVGSLFGYSIDIAGDVNNDDYDDIIVGAPNEDVVYLYYGEDEPDTTPTYIDLLWDDNPSTPSIVDFDTEYNNTDSDTNTWGLYVPPGTSWDGWDWAEDEYGNQNDGGITFTWRSPNEVAGGPDMGVAMPGGVGVGCEIDYNGAEDMIKSAAFGIQFNVTAANWTTISTQVAGGASLLVEFDWALTDRDATEEPIWVKARIGNSNASMWYLGEDTDGGSLTVSTSTFNDPDPEVYVWESPNGELYNGVNFGTISDRAKLDITQNITGAGTYYLDFGVKTQTGTNGYTGGNEGFTCQFDDVALLLKRVWAFTPDVIINNTGINESFGHSVAGLPDLNGDAFADMIIGAPMANNSAGLYAGASYIFYGGGSLPATINADTADYINYGNFSDQQFGFAVGNCGPIAGSTHFPGVGAPYWRNETGITHGKAVVLGIPPEPIINVVSPSGGETVSGIINLNATATDPNDDINLAIGIGFSIQEFGGTWIGAGYDMAPAAGDLFEVQFDTTTVPDGTYRIRANVTDLLSNFEYDTGGWFTIDNPWDPAVEFYTPTPDMYVNTTVQLIANGTDIDTNLNFTRGMEFSYSLDNVTADPWKSIAFVNTTTNEWNFTYDWDISGMVDGLYYLKATIFDLDNLSASAYTSFNIENPKLPPVVTVTNPWNTSLELSGDVTINVSVIDPNGDIPAGDINFFYSKEGGNWTSIGTADTRATEFYKIWDSTTVQDGLFAFKVNVTDDSGITVEDITPQFLVHNNVNNAPIIHVIYPNHFVEYQKVGVIDVQAYVFDLEDNIDADGAQFFYSTDKTNWVLFGNDTTGDNHIFTAPLDTNTLSDDYYWIKVEAKDTDGNVGMDLSNTSFLVHNRLDNPPVVRVIHPNGGELLKGIINLTAYAADFENNIDAKGVEFYYSTDGVVWIAIGNAPNPVGKVYSLIWDTSTVDDGATYLINATVTDTTKLSSSDISNATFSIKNLEFSPPSIELREPTDGEVVSLETNVTAMAIDLDGDITAAGVTFEYQMFGNDTWVVIGSDAEAAAGNIYRVIWDTNTTATPNGKYLVRASVQDSKGLKAVDMLSTEITISNWVAPAPRDEDHAPVVDITAPANGATVENGITISATATDEDGDLISVEFFYKKGGTETSIVKKLSGTTDLYSTTWDTAAVTNGEYTIIARAIDSKGLSSEATVTIKVDNPVDPPQPDDDDDDDTQAGFLAQYWWIFIVLLALLLLIIVIVILVTRKKKFEVQVGPLELYGKPVEGRAVLEVGGKEYNGGIDPKGIARIPDVDGGMADKDAWMTLEIADKTFRFSITLVKDEIIPAPSGWNRPKGEKKKEAKVEEKKIEPETAMKDEEEVETWDTSGDDDISSLDALDELDQLALPEGDPDEFAEQDEDDINLDLDSEGGIPQLEEPIDDDLDLSELDDLEDGPDDLPDLDELDEEDIDLDEGFIE